MRAKKKKSFKMEERKMKVLRKGIIFIFCLTLVVCLYGEKNKKPALTLDQMRMEIAKQGHTFTVGKNSVTDRPLEMICGLKEPPDWRQTGRFDGGFKGELGLPASYDWRDYGVVTAVQNQGSCGSCWAFGTIGSYESCVAAAGGTLYNLSEEWLLDCNTLGYGCDGGWWGFPDMYDGVPKESCYPYAGIESTCITTCPKYYPMAAWYYVGNSYSVPSTTDLKNAIYNQGPIAVAVCVDSYFQGYTGGIFTHTSSGSVNHAVILVGWNDSGSYWILKNSWATGWGENGYMRIAYGANSIGYAAAYGVPGDVAPLPPVAEFSGNPTTLEVGNSVQFSDLSTNIPTSWSWTFEGGTPATSTQQNPAVTYNTIGTYSVTLSVCNGQGCDTETKVDYINVQEAVIEYCDSQGFDYSYEWLARVVVGPLDNSSGAAGYTDFTSITANLTAGATCDVSLTPGFSDYPYTEFWKIWIDYNLDGDFEDAGEEVFNGSGSSTVNGSFTVASVCVTTRMRVSMKWNSAPTPCEAFSYGEVEDYTVNINTVKPDFNQDGRADIIWRYYGTGGYNAVWLKSAAAAGTGSISSTKGSIPGTDNPLKVFDMKNIEADEVVVVDMDRFTWKLKNQVIEDGFAGYQATKGKYNPGFNPFDVKKNNPGQSLSQAMAVVPDPRDDPQAVELPVVDDQNWKIAGTGDFNGDGKVDIVWSNGSTAHNCVWYMNGTTYAGYGRLPDGSTTDWVLGGVGDFNQDGNPDLVWHNEADGRGGIWYMDGVTAISYDIMTTGASVDWKLCGTGDFNNDGDVDLVWRNISDGRNAVWYMDGPEMTSVGWLDTVANLDWKLRGTGDFNGDGKVDLVWTCISDGCNCIWYLDNVTLTSVEFLTTVTNTDWKIEN
jgi:PKD repeat protein